MVCARHRFAEAGCLFKISLFYCVTCLPICMSVHSVHAHCPQRSGEDVRSPGTGVTRVVNTSEAVS